MTTFVFKRNVKMNDDMKCIATKEFKRWNVIFFLTTVKHCGQLGVVAILTDMREVHLALSLRKTTQAEQNCSAGLATKMSRGTRPP